MDITGDVVYAACAYNDRLTIFACGLNVSGGYTNSIIKNKDHFELSCAIRGPAPSVITMFEVCETFDGDGNMRSIVIKDDNGEHQVQVVGLSTG